MHRDTAAAAFRQFLAVVRLFGGELQHGGMAPMLLQEVEPEGEGILARFVRELVDHHLDRLRRVGVTDRAPP